MARRNPRPSTRRNQPQPQQQQQSPAPNYNVTPPDPWNSPAQYPSLQSDPLSQNGQLAANVANSGGGFGGGGNNQDLGLQPLNLPNWTDVLGNYKPANPGLPLTGYGEQARNQLDASLNSNLAQYQNAYAQIPATYNLQQARINTNQGLDTQHLKESLADRGIYQSGITGEDLRQLQGQYNRNYQDLLLNAQNQAQGVLGGVSSTFGDYYSQLADLMNQIAATEYQNPNSPVNAASNQGGGGNQQGGNKGGGSKGKGGNGKQRTKSGRRTQS